VFFIKAVHRRFEKTSSETGSAKILTRTVHLVQNTVHLTHMNNIRVLTGFLKPAMNKAILYDVNIMLFFFHWERPVVIGGLHIFINDCRILVFFLLKNSESFVHVRAMEWIAVQWINCIASYEVHYIGGRDPLGPAARRAAARGGASSGGGTWGRQHPLKP
jgi:hypothetical protein